ncbi:MAG: phenylalanine--tRNA ligase subunit beta [Candidatus Aenigmarchaeota archaeon]|nr:phenylalanine--tRNA ligase subunit beta [Candidatus Aenigmarchaeota archaeon]
MPVIRYDKVQLRKLIGKRLSDEQLSEAIQLVKPNVEGFEGNEIIVEHTADRPDLFGIEGLARSVSTYMGTRKGLTKYKIGKPKVEMRMTAVSSRPYVSTAVVRKVEMKDFFESMIQIQESLSSSIGRRRAKVAVGVHDLDKIKGKITYQSVSRNEKMTALGEKEEMKLSEVLENTEKGKEYGPIIKGSKMWPVFTDQSGIISFPPILNSQRTAVTDKTKNLFVEVTGTDKQAVRDVMAILISNFGERFPVEGVKMRHERRSEVTPDLSEGVMEIGTGMVNRTLGTSLSSKEIISLLSRMGYDTLGSGEKMEVIVPAYRADVLHPVDIVEDVAIAYGYNNFKPEIPAVHTTGRQTDVERMSRKASISLVGFGFQEIIGSALSNPSDQIEKMELSGREVVELENPSSADYSCARASLVPGMLKFLAANRHNEYPQNVFEVGDVVLPDKAEETGARNERRVAGAVCHSKSGFGEMNFVFDGMMKSMGRGCSFRECDSPMYIPGRGVDVYMGDRYIGTFGELHPKVVQNWEIGMPTTVFELDLEGI